jgi:hypothetical protein
LERIGQLKERLLEAVEESSQACVKRFLEKGSCMGAALSPAYPTFDRQWPSEPCKENPVTKIRASVSGETFLHFMLKDGTSSASDGGVTEDWMEFDPSKVGRIKLAHYDLQTFVIELYSREGERMLRAGFDDEGADVHWIELQEG